MEKNVTDPKQIANAFNNFFVNVGPNTGRSIPISFKSQQHTFIHTLDESKSTGPSSIPISLLKTAAPYIILPLCKLINISFHTGVFPDSIKVAKVVPNI